MWYIFYGEEEFTKSEAVAKLRSRIETDGLGTMNTITLDGDDLSIEDLANACNTVPFLTDRRLIIVKGLLSRLQKQGASGQAYAERLCEYLPQMPETTRLIFLESCDLKQSHPLMKLADRTEDAYVRQFESYDASDSGGRRKLWAWIRQRVKQKGATIAPPAIELLIRYVGNNLRLLDQELEKLAAYCAYERAITEKDVEELIFATIEPDIFGLVDVIGQRQGDRALKRLHELIADDQSPLYILAMIGRQARLLLATADAMQRRGRNRPIIGKEIGVSYDFVVKKLIQQAQLFSIKELYRILDLILHLDQSIKTGQVDAMLGLELLILQICGAPRAHQPKTRERSS